MKLRQDFLVCYTGLVQLGQNSARVAAFLGKNGSEVQRTEADLKMGLENPTLTLADRFLMEAALADMENRSPRKREEIMLPEDREDQELQIRHKYVTAMGFHYTS